MKRNTPNAMNAARRVSIIGRKVFLIFLYLSQHTLLPLCCFGNEIVDETII
jgi:hypothetical protein